MALQTSITLESGIELFNAYFKVTSVHINRPVDNNNSIEIEVTVFKDEQARLDQLHHVLTLTYFVEPEDYNNFFSINVLDNNTNIIKQCYMFLKTKDLFQGASDV